MTDATTPSLTNPNPKREDERDTKTGVSIETRAREMLAAEYAAYVGEGPYPSYVDLALNGSGSFTLCSIRAIAKALATSALASVSPSPADPVRAALEVLVKSLDDLIADSEGVAGLHRNGDVATWDELTSGGRFEDWLSSLDAARAALSVSTPTGEGEEPDPVEKIQEIHRRHLNRIIDDWDQHNALDEGEISFLIRMAGNYLRPFTPIVLQGETTALAHPPQGGERDGHVKRVAEVVELILQEQWDEWVGDTDCFPGDFTITRGPKLWFKAGAWARLVAECVATAVVPAAPLPPSESSGEEA